jgi:hypothetical protein
MEAAAHMKKMMERRKYVRMSRVAYMRQRRVEGTGSRLDVSEEPLGEERAVGRRMQELLEAKKREDALQ